MTEDPKPIAGDVSQRLFPVSVRCLLLREGRKASYSICCVFKAILGNYALVSVEVKRR